MASIAAASAVRTGRAGNAGAVGLAGLRRSVGGNNEMVTAVDGDRKLLQVTVNEPRLVNSPCGGSQVGQPFQAPAPAALGTRRTRGTAAPACTQ